MKNASKALTVGVGSALLMAGASQAVAAAAGPANALPSLPTAQVAQAASQAIAVPHVLKGEVRGAFAFTQTEVSSNAWMAQHIAGASRYLCGSGVVASGEAAAADPASWVLEVTGAVANPYEATIGELAATTEVQTALMGCSCGANPADGLAVANALVEGIPMTLLLQMAQPDADANTLVFVSADGYEVALPYDYVTNRYCPLVFSVNGSDLIESVGGTNQLWLGSTPGNYFARDIVEVRVEVRDTPPADPTSDEARSELANLPNVGVAFGGEVA